MRADAADFQMTRGLLQIIENEGNADDVVAFLQDKNLPVDINSNHRIDAQENFYTELDSLTNAVATGKYPSPPSRELMFVLNKEHQSKLLEEFVRFVMTDKQQAYLLDNGFVPINKELNKKENEKLLASELQTDKR